MSQPTTPALPAPISNAAGRTITQRLTDVEAAVNALIAYLPSRASASDMQALRGTLDADRRAAEARHQDLLKAVAQSAQPPVVFPDLSGLQKEVRAQGESITRLLNAPTVPPVAPDTTTLEEAVHALDERVLDLETRPATAPDDAPLEPRVAALEQLLGLTPTMADAPTSAALTESPTDAPSAPLNEVQDA